jgi:hypothetical protein
MLLCSKITTMLFNLSINIEFDMILYSISLTSVLLLVGTKGFTLLLACLLVCNS